MSFPREIYLNTLGIYRDEPNIDCVRDYHLPAANMHQGRGVIIDGRRLFSHGREIGGVRIISNFSAWSKGAFYLREQEISGAIAEATQDFLDQYGMVLQEGIMQDNRARVEGVRSRLASREERRSIDSTYLPIGKMVPSRQLIDKGLPIEEEPFETPQGIELNEQLRQMTDELRQKRQQLEDSQDNPSQDQ